MRFFGRCKPDKWHRAIDCTTNGAKPSHPDFPWDSLRRLTDVYVKKKKLEQEQVDRDLLDLIWQHNEKDVAVAACAHALSPEAIKITLSHLEVRYDALLGLECYLQSIVAASHVNWAAVSAVDGMWARELTSYLAEAHHEEALGQQLRNIIVRLGTALTPENLLFGRVVAHARNICARFAAQLERWKGENQWLLAYTAIECLFTIPTVSENAASLRFGPQQLLDDCLPTWRTWSSWKPSVERLSLWEQSPFTRHASLGNLLALEGPPFTEGLQKTLWEGLVEQTSNASVRELRWGTSHILLEFGTTGEARQILNRLLRVIDIACSANSDYTTLVLQLLVGRPIVATNITVLEELNFIHNKRLDSIVLQSYTQVKEVCEIKQLFPILEGLESEPLRNCLGNFLVDRISNHIEVLRERLCRQLDSSSVWDDTAIELTELIAGVVKVCWLLPLFRSTSEVDTSHFPTEKATKSLVALRFAVTTSWSRGRGSLPIAVNEYCRALFLQGSVQHPEPRISLVHALMDVWQQGLGKNQLDLALSIANSQDLGLPVQYQCLAQIRILSDEMITVLQPIVSSCAKEDHVSCLVNFIDLFGAEERADVVLCWRSVAYPLISSNDKELFEYGTANGMSRWLDFLDSVRHIYGGMMEWFCSRLLHPDLHAWVQRLQSSDLVSTVVKLETSIGSGPAMRCFMTGPALSLHADALFEMLELARLSEAQHWQPVMGRTIDLLEFDGSNAPSLLSILVLLCDVTLECAETLARILSLNQDRQKGLVQVLAAASLQRPNMNASDYIATKSITEYLKFDLDFESCLDVQALKKTADYMDERFTQLIAEAQRLDDLRLSLCAVEPLEVLHLLGKHNIKAPSLADDMLACLPSTLLDTVEKVGDNEIELHFPLDGFTKLQKQALGFAKAQSLLIGLRLPSKDVTASFCVRINDADAAPANEDCQRWLNLDDEDEPCEQDLHFITRRGEYQLSLSLCRDLHNGIRSLETIHATITASINSMARSCVLCGSTQVWLVRPSICETPVCTDDSKFYRANLRILLADIWQDPPVVDLLLTAIFATAKTDNMTLIESSPFTNAAEALDLLQSLPSVHDIRRLLELCMGGQDDRFQFDRWKLNTLPSLLPAALAWACNHYRGLVVTAAGQLRVPMFPHSHQFLLANASPALEKAFAAQFTNAGSISMVLFHGTSLDRLYAILSEGLRICSGTPLERNGAAFGSGIYMAEEPKKAWEYATSTTIGPWGNSGWKGSAFHNVRVLLGCELAGRSTAHFFGIHVINDASRLMVRYIFLMKPDAKMPLAMHVVPAMQSTFASLRARAL